MKYLIFIFSILLNHSSSLAQNCADQLTVILKATQNDVRNHFEVGSPCYKAAIDGRKNGLPGCFPPAALSLVSLLKPNLNKAKSVCQNACQVEGLKEDCEDLIADSHLRHQGISGLLHILNSFE